MSRQNQGEKSVQDVGGWWLHIIYRMTSACKPELNRSSRLCGVRVRLITVSGAERCCLSRWSMLTISAGERTVEVTIVTFINTHSTCATCATLFYMRTRPLKTIFSSWALLMFVHANANIDHHMSLSGWSQSRVSLRLGIIMELICQAMVLICTALPPPPTPTTF